MEYLVYEHLVKAFRGSGDWIGVHVGVQAVHNGGGLHGGTVDAQGRVDVGVGDAAQVEQAVEEVHGGEFLVAVGIDGGYMVGVLTAVSL